jgi:hypothetical protein
VRLPVANVCRAFPELDPFTDAECERFVARVRARRMILGFWAAAICIFLVWMLKIFLGGIAMVALELAPRSDDGGLALGVVLSVLACSTSLIGGFLARDVLLIRAIRRGVDNARCRNCNQSLLGLPLMPGGGRETVRCPECGQVTLLDEIGMTHAELIPRESAEHTAPERF